ncbi:MAG: hypothetical protein H7A25_06275 [Leptospiraceae bacterium]|nr:hypothetical protein [Leptospiraceae bacterium]
MKGKQINFFLTPEDVKELDKYLSENEFVIIPQPLYKNKIELIDSLLYSPDNGEKIRPEKYIVSKNDLENIELSYIDTHRYHLIGLNDKNPAIEFTYISKAPEDKKIKRGRLYYTDVFYDNSELRKKNERFTESAKNLFTWFKKMFNDTTLSGYKGYQISAKAAEWKKSTGGILEI